MVTLQTLSGIFDTARRLVDFLEQDGFDIETAAWVVEDEGRSRLYIVPRKRSGGKLEQMKSVAETISRHRDELPESHDLRYSVVNPDDPLIQAVTSVRSPDGRIRGAYSNGTYVDEAYVFRPAA
jgi:hypothetical protein